MLWSDPRHVESLLENSSQGVVAEPEIDEDLVEDSFPGRVGAGGESPPG